MNGSQKLFIITLQNKQCYNCDNLYLNKRKTNRNDWRYLTRWLLAWFVILPSENPPFIVYIVLFNLQEQETSVAKS